MVDSLFAYIYPLLTFSSCFAYLPQIRQLALAKTLPTGLSLLSWIIWLSESFIAAGYGLFHLHDPMFSLLSMLDLVLIGTVVMLILYLNYIKFSPRQVLASVSWYGAGDIGHITAPRTRHAIAFQPHEHGLL